MVCFIREQKGHLLPNEIKLDFYAILKTNNKIMSFL